MTIEMGGDLVGAGSSAGGPPSAGAAVVVPVEAAAPAAPPAPAARTTTTRVSARVTLAGAADGAPPLWWTRLSERLALAAALFLLGCAAAGLAFFAMTLPPAVTGKACVPTDAEVARLRTASEYLLLAASSQMLAATMGLLVPAWLLAVFGTLLGGLTSYHAYDVLGMLVTCHGSAHGALSFHLWLFLVVLWAAIGTGAIVSFP